MPALQIRAAVVEVRAGVAEEMRALEVRAAVAEERAKWAMARDVVN